MFSCEGRWGEDIVVMYGVWMGSSLRSLEYVSVYLRVRSCFFFGFFVFWGVGILRLLFRYFVGRYFG